MPQSIRPGDVLADRYRLIDLLTESGGGRFWRAHDRVLQRHVAVHVIGESDERASGLLEAARRSATVLDRRLLRVLDADRTNGLCFVVNEWGQGHSLDVMLAKSGPLAPRRAAWLISEVAASIAVAHAAGIAHGRLVPENVLVDRTGSVRVIGFAVDAALHGLPAGRVSTDVADLGGLLYCALTAKWPGVSRSDLAPAPHEHGQVLRPRQVRAGIPRPLDELCDLVVNPYANAGAAARRADLHDLTTARGISDYLAEFVGDASGMAEAELSAGSTPGEPETVVLTPLPRLLAPSENATSHPVDPSDLPLDQPEEQSNDEPTDEPDDPTADQPQVEAAAPPGAPAKPDVPLQPAGADEVTQAGMPIFDDENDEISWLQARSEPAPPPPPFEDPPERPLFAPEPTDGQPVRTPRPGAAASTGGQDYWPWDSSSTGSGSSTGTGIGAVIAVEDEPDDEMPGRNWLRLAGAVAAALLLLVAIVVAYNLGRGRTPLGAEPSDAESTTSRNASPSGSATPLTGLVATDLDPQGDPPRENPELAPQAVDGDPATAWRSLTYKQNFGPSGLKTGLGLVVDLGESSDISEIQLRLLGKPTDVSIYISEVAPSDVEGLTPAATSTIGRRGTLTLDEPVAGQYVTVWLTSLPQVGSGFRGEIAEIVVLGP